MYLTILSSHGLGLLVPSEVRHDLGQLKPLRLADASRRTHAAAGLQQRRQLAEPADLKGMPIEAEARREQRAISCKL